MLNPHGQIVDVDIFTDNLTEPLVAVVALPLSWSNIKVVRPEGAQWWFLLSQAFVDSVFDVEVNEMLGGYFPAIGKERVEFFCGERINGFDGGEVVFAADFTGFCDSAV